MILRESISGSITTADGSSTIAHLSDSNIIRASISRQCCGSGTFEIGSVNSATLNLVLRLQGVTAYLHGSRIQLFLSWDGGDPFSMGIFWVTSCKRKGQIYTITAQDAVIWLEQAVADRNDSGDPSTFLERNIASYGATLQYFMEDVVRLTNQTIQSKAGISDLLQWTSYDAAAHGGMHYCNEMILADGAMTIYPATFYYINHSGVGTTDSPREYMGWLAELAGGFVYARESDGALTLGQFGTLNDIAAVSTSDIQDDSFDIADFCCVLNRIYVYGERGEDTWTSGTIWSNASSLDGSALFEISIDSNPFLDGFTTYFVPDYSDNIATIHDNLWAAIHIPSDAYPDRNYYIRPFSLKTHKLYPYQLGQRIRIAYRSPGETDEMVYESIITSIKWTLHGGFELKCSGENMRSLLASSAMSKSDRVLKETRGRYRKTRSKISDMQNRLDALENQ